MNDTYSSFVKKHKEACMRYCYGKMQTYADTEEIVDEAFSKLWLKWNERESFDDLSNRNWVYTTIHNLIRNRNHKTIRRQEVNLDDYAEHLCDPVGIDDDLRYKELVAAILCNLNEKEKTLFTLIFLENRTYEELEAILHTNENTLHIQKFRLRKKIEKILKNSKNF